MLCLLVLLPVNAQERLRESELSSGIGKRQKKQMKDSVMLDNVTVTGKSKTQRLREGPLV